MGLLRGLHGRNSDSYSLCVPGPGRVCRKGLSCKRATDDRLFPAPVGSHGVPSTQAPFPTPPDTPFSPLSPAHSWPLDKAFPCRAGVVLLFKILWSCLSKMGERTRAGAAPWHRRGPGHSEGRAEWLQSTQVGLAGTFSLRLEGTERWGTHAATSMRVITDRHLYGLIWYKITGFTLENSFEIHVFCLGSCLKSKITEFLERSRGSESCRKGLGPGIRSQYPSGPGVLILRLSARRRTPTVKASL